MNHFLSTTGNSVMRAVQTNGDKWAVDEVLSGINVNCFAADLVDSNIIYAGTQGNGLLSSADCGKSWRPAGLPGQTVKSIAISPIIPGLIYAGTKPALVFVSRDYGQKWEEVFSFRKIFSRHFWFSPAEAPFSAYVQGIALSPTDPNVILAGIEAGAVVRSADGGKTWQDHRKGALRDCHSITFHPTDGNRAYEAGGTGAGVAVSQDGGNTWAQPKVDLDRHYGWACAADPIQPEICYISVSPSPMKAHGEKNAEACIYRSMTNGGWEKLGGGLPQPLEAMPYALITSPNEPGTVHAGLSNGDVWKSQDFGDTWTKLPFNLGSVHRSMIMLLS